MRLCKDCGSRDAMIRPQRDKPSVGVEMAGSPSGTLTFFFPTEDGDYCYFCGKMREGRISFNRGENLNKYRSNASPFGE